MIIAYMDEAGSTGARLDAEGQPFHYVGALLVPGGEWLAIKADLQGIRDKLRESIQNHPDFEFHGAELFNGTGCWGTMQNPGHRLVVYAKCIDVLVGHRVRIVYGCADKQLLQGYSSPMHPHGVAVWLCLERIARHLNSKGWTRPSIVGSIVADNASRDFRRISEEVLGELKTAGPPFGQRISMSRIVDVIHYMDSRQSFHLQLCDLVLYAIRRRDVTQDTLGGITDKIEPLISDYRYFPY